jgi:hypothetical protein
LEVIEMNPIIIDMLVKVKQAEIAQEAEKRRVYGESRQSGDQSDPLQKLQFSLAAMGVIILLVVWAIVSV